MDFINSLSAVELSLAGAFTIVYALYLLRLHRIKQQLKQGFRKAVFKFSLRTTYIALLIITLLGPSFGIEREEIKAVGKDIFMLVDLSQSMNANDVRPSRLRKAKHELLRISESFKSDRIGLIIFTSEAFLYCPLTYDKNIINLYINSLNTDLVLNNSTEFAPAIDLAIEKFDSTKESLRESIKNRITILVSDGEDFGEGLNPTLKNAKKRNMRIFTLGIGTKQGSKIPNKYGFVKDQNGKTTITKLDNNTLLKIADASGGEYFEISRNNNETEQLIEAIKSIRGELQVSKEAEIESNKYIYALVLALVLLCLDLLIQIPIFRLY